MKPCAISASLCRSFWQSMLPASAFSRHTSRVRRAAELLKAGRLDPDWLAQVRAMCRLLYPAGLNIDYYPTNFVPYGGVLYYIDYECNPYAPQWDFEHWGMQYWTLSKP